MLDTATPVPRRGWWWLGLAALTYLIVGDLPLLHTLLPLHRPVLVILPFLAVAAIIGWWKGGSRVFATGWIVLALLAAWLAVRSGSDEDLFAARWSAVATASFAATFLALRPRQFLTAGVVAVAVAVFAGAVIVAVVPSGLAEFRRSSAAATTIRSNADRTNWEVAKAQLVLSGQTRQDSTMAQLVEQFDQTVLGLPQTARTVFPAMLGLQTLAAMALAWTLFHRLSRTRIGDELTRLREFRFNDHWIWAIIVGLVFVLLPVLTELRVLGINVLVFFGALYLLRGLAVVTWFIRPGRGAFGVLIGAMLFLLLRDGLPIALALVGIGDTWADWRRRIRPAVS
jgi:hypothetical protein